MGTRYLGIVFHENVVINLLSIREHMHLFGAFRDIPLDVLDDSIDFLAHLSLLANPPIVIMDETKAGVDAQARQLIWKTIASLEGTTSPITIHALEEAEAVSSRISSCRRGNFRLAEPRRSSGASTNADTFFESTELSPTFQRLGGSKTARIQSQCQSLPLSN
jgi:ABC-type multidrug transport system ATPase subunit